MNATYKLDTKAFRKKRALLLVMMILPSLIIDAVILFHIFERNPVILDSMGNFDINEIFMLLFINALLFKSAGIIIYYVLKSYRKKSEVRISQGKVIYRKRRVVGYTFYFNYRIYIEYYITAPESISKRRNGSIVLTGEFPVVYYTLNGQDIHSKSMRRRCVIPGYFENMDSILKRIENMAAKKHELKLKVQL